MDPQRFDELVSDALDLVPPKLAAVMDNVVVLVADRHPDDDELLGLYEGVALTERDSHYAGSLPDTITIYRDALLDDLRRRRGGRRGGEDHRDARDRPPLRHRRRPVARIGLGLTGDDAARTGR